MIIDGVIYKITNNVNGKNYIGQTINYNERVRHHKQLPFRKNDKQYNYPLYKAIRKYGLENFTFEIIDRCNDFNELNKKEIYYIEKFNSLVDNDKGYNLDKGGKNGRKSEITKQKIGDAQRGKLNHAYGKRGGDCHNAKKVINLTTNKIYPSMLDCALDEFGDRKYLKNISSVCSPNSNKQSFRGNVYRKIDKDGNIVEKNNMVCNEAFNKVKVIDIKSNKVFDSISDTAKYFSISNNMVRDRIYNRIKNDKFKEKFDLKIYK